jgi:hypothetical protein
MASWQLLNPQNLQNPRSDTRFEGFEGGKPQARYPAQNSAPHSIRALSRERREVPTARRVHTSGTKRLYGVLASQWRQLAGVLIGRSDRARLVRYRARSE